MARQTERMIESPSGETKRPHTHLYCNWRQMAAGRAEDKGKGRNHLVQLWNRAYLLNSCGFFGVFPYTLLDYTLRDLLVQAPQAKLPDNQQARKAPQETLDCIKCHAQVNTPSGSLTTSAASFLARPSPHHPML